MTDSRTAAIIHEYQSTQRRVAEISAQFGITQQGIYDILKRHNVPRRLASGVDLRRCRSEPKKHDVLSSYHQVIGEALSRHRQAKLGTLSEAAKATGLTQWTLRRIEAGTYDLKTSEILKFCDLMGLSLWKVIQDAERQAGRFQHAT